MMTKILLIKTGAAGDVVRTTVLLNALQGAVTWVIDSRYEAILPIRHPNLHRVVTLEQAQTALQHEIFDHTISLEEDMACALLASKIPTKKITGIYVENKHLVYTNDAAGWYDLSLVSTLGPTAANEAKKKNTATFQQLLLSMFGLSFSNEPYCIYRNFQIKRDQRLIGIETRVGARWPNKGWSGYPALINRLQHLGYECRLFEERDNITEYLDDIAGCGFIISGDTLAMHVAMAYQIPSIAIFNCTSPAEIYDYGSLRKIVSPLLKQSFYKTHFSQAVIDSISVDEVYAAFLQHAGINAWQKV
ncbi:glycosyltransferase family 9 protein [Niastella caeni]|uniref:Glycosyltransferase family 9 protein n=1 Tax=Niastella caeni TaxID=2569763 RepID=A0A4S8H790_9BACT|nr:glycosyltransferase family 9 protein [Niastella caeni]THU30437.1 glycosyltransferase family 9 protein [Niastella caeni]